MRKVESAQTDEDEQPFIEYKPSLKKLICPAIQNPSDKSLIDLRILI